MRRGRFLFFPLFLGVMVPLGNSAEPSLPDPAPVFQSQGHARQDPVFLVESFAWNRHGDRKG